MKSTFHHVIVNTALTLGILTSPLSMAETAVSNTDKARALIESIENRDPTPAGYINPTRYIQHNLAVKDGLAGFGEVLQQLPKGSAKAKVIRAFEDGDYVVLHTQYDFFGPKAGFDVFRFEQGLIVEHWDNLQATSAPNPSGRTQFDGATDITDQDKTTNNKALVADFVSQILMQGQMDKIKRFIGPKDSDYLQHNPYIADGLNGLGAALAAMAEQGQSMVYRKNHRILGQGNFVLSISEGEFMGQDVAFYDLFRVESNKIVEHWDTVEPILPKAKWQNQNGKFNFR
ncbi:nuclear transport factor 2 family protein [Shewanella sp. GXUN23E]|uniref:nuclear transport factor 2 family protein n=1 Tax=Shewanella sp. GXUN23E TaxID=3422498 RepID=UPI003D7E1F82